MINQSIAVIVDVIVKIKSIRLQQKEDKTISLLVDLDMIQFWKDDRLQVPAALQLSPNPKLTLDFRYKQAVWTPLLQLTNTKQVNLNTFFEPIVFLEINNRKQIFLNAKLTLDLDCSYQLNNKHRHGDNKLERFGRSIGQFPFDAKECGIELISLSNTLDVLSLRWSDFELAPSQTNEFTIENKRSEHCVTISEAGSFSCLRVRFSLKRKFGTAFANYMAPISLFTFIAYLTFWIPTSQTLTGSMPGATAPLAGHLIQVRVLLLVYALSALCWKWSINEATTSLADSTRTGSITVWHLTNLTFILIAIVELIAQLNQAAVRSFLLRRLLLQDPGNLGNLTGQSYGAMAGDSNRNATLTLHPKQSTKVHLNNGGSGNYHAGNTPPINSQDASAQANRSNDVDRAELQQGRNRIYLKMLGLRPPLNGRHQSSGQTEQELASKDYDGQQPHSDSAHWLDELFQAFYPIFYAAFMFLFLFISLIS